MNKRKERSESSEGGMSYMVQTVWKTSLWDSTSSQQNSWVYSPLRSTPVSLGEWFLMF